MYFNSTNCKVDKYSRLPVPVEFVNLNKASMCDNFLIKKIKELGNGYKLNIGFQ
jgi:hypothetical protein